MVKCFDFRTSNVNQKQNQQQECKEYKHMTCIMQMVGSDLTVIVFTVIIIDLSLEYSYEQLNFCC